MSIVRGLMVFFKWAYAAILFCIAACAGLLIYAWIRGLFIIDEDEEEEADEHGC